ncbi:MAG: glycosyltransferase family 2 protein [Mariprofundaceae bacterium]
MRLSVVIPTWNAWDMLARTLDALKPALVSIHDEVEVIVVDDGGDDETLTMLDKHHSQWVRVVRRVENGGFSAACNSGIDAASGRWVLLLNNDMKPDKNAIKRLLAFGEDCDEDVFAIRPSIIRGCVLEPDEYAHMAMRFRSNRGMLRCLIVQHAESTSGSDAFPVCSGGAGLFRRSMLEKMDAFDEIFSPFYWEDVDLSYRALARGWRVLYYPAARFCHAARGSIRRSFRTAEIERISQRNAYLFHWLNLTDPNRLMAHFAWLPFQLLRGLVPGEQWRILGAVDALARIGAVMQGRRERASVRQISDREIIERSCRGEVVKIWVQ